MADNGPDVVRYSTHEGVALLVIDSPPVNLLSGEVRQGLAAGLDRAEADAAVRAIVVTGGGRAFIAGADISEFDKPPIEPSLDEIFLRFERSPKPIVAAINGVALGGGMEVALCCDYRVAGPKASVGLPEVKLGLLPGGGGTQRLPRLIGAARALELLLFGNSIPAKEAAQLGIVDEVVSGDLVEVALGFARSLRERAAPQRKLRDDNSRVVADRGKLGSLASICERARAAMPRHFALEMIVQCVEAAVNEASFDEGMEVERRCFAQCLAHPQHGALKHLFFAERECAKVRGVERDTPRHTVARVGFEGGAGRESRALCERLQRAGIEVSALRVGDPALAEVDLVILDTSSSAEFVSSLAKGLSQTALLFSVASEQDLVDLAELTGRPSQTLGVELSPTGRVLEFIRTQATSEVMLATTVTLCKRIGVIPIVSQRGRRSQHRESLGGRLRAAFLRECAALRQAGVSNDKIIHSLDDYGFSTVDLDRSASPTDHELPQKEIVARCMAAWANEGRRTFDEGVVTRESDIDIVAVRGYGFPEISGGPMYWQRHRDD